MIYVVHSVLDKAVGAFLPPFFARSKGEAMRSFSEACNNAEHQFSKHAGDYSLYYLGQFDDASAKWDMVDPVRQLLATECIVPADPFTPEARLGAR